MVRYVCSREGHLLVKPAATFRHQKTARRLRAVQPGTVDKCQSMLMNDQSAPSDRCSGTPHLMPKWARAIISPPNTSASHSSQPNQGQAGENSLQDASPCFVAIVIPKNLLFVYKSQRAARNSVSFCPSVSTETRFSANLISG